MSVNGVAINVGQKWKTRTGLIAKVLSYSVSETYCWRVQYTEGGLGMIWPVTDRGEYHSGQVNPYDLVELVDVTDPGTTSVKETNPKEAIGDKKTPLWLCSAIAMAHWSAAQFAGLIKYGSWNWRAAGVRTSTYLSAIARHWARYANGERCDPVDGTHHLGNIMACCAILLEAEAIDKLNDDRSPRADLQATFDEVEAIIARLKVQYADKAPKHWTLNDELPS